MMPAHSYNQGAVKSAVICAIKFNGTKGQSRNALAFYSYLITTIENTRCRNNLLVIISRDNENALGV